MSKNNEIPFIARRDVFYTYLAIFLLIISIALYIYFNSLVTAFLVKMLGSVVAFMLILMFFDKFSESEKKWQNLIPTLVVFITIISFMFIFVSGHSDNRYISAKNVIDTYYESINEWKETAIVYSFLSSTYEEMYSICIGDSEFTDNWREKVDSKIINDWNLTIEEYYAIKEKHGVK